MQWLIPVRRVEFTGPTGWADLRKLVEAEAKATALIPIREPIQVMIRPDTGVTAGDGLRVNAEAFSQLCYLLSGGLFRNFANVYELSEKPNPERQAGVLKAYNAMMTISFERVIGHRFVVDKNTKCALGIVGSKYQFVPNVRLVQETNPWLTGVTKPAYKLISARMRNRDLRVIMVRKDEAVKDQGIPYAQGLAMFNSETTKRAVFLPQLCFDGETGSFSMENDSKTNRLIHRKRKGFAALLSDVIRDSINHELQLQDWLSSIRILRRTPIRPAHASAQVAASVERRLAAKDIGSAAIDLVLRYLTEASGDGVPTKWMLYRALVMAAESFGDSERVLRQLAYGVLEKANVRN